MSDLQCPATVVVVRHGQSEGNLSRRMSSAAPGSALSPLGREQARAVGAALCERRVARVYTSPLLRARQTAEQIAVVVGADVEVLPGVHELGLGTLEGSDSLESWAELDAVFVQWLDGDLSVGIGGDESGSEVVSRVEHALDGVADLHRGETVVVVSHGGVMGLALPRIAGARPQVVRSRPVPDAGLVELSGDADGWRLVSWPDPPSARGPELVDLLGRADAVRARSVGPAAPDVGGTAP